jgi:ABC-2 type transport system permease protein
MLAFMVLNWVQLAFMLLVGRWLVPWLGGDALSLAIAPAGSGDGAGHQRCGGRHGAADRGGTKNFEHAAALGGGLNVVLAAIAGVMVPRMLMPPGLQTLSAWSPMGWALDGLQSVFFGRA